MKAFKKFARNRFRSLIDYLKDFSEKRDEEFLHKIRVDVKKIKSILELVKFSNKKFRAHKNYFPFRSIFRRAGEIRDPEIQAGLLLRYNIEGVKVRNDKKEVSEFISDTANFVAQIREQEIQIWPFINSVRKDDLKDFIRKKNKQIKSDLTMGSKIRDIHKVRKAIKLVIYLSEVNRSVKEKVLTFYHEMERLIGDLHDKQVVLGLTTKGSKSGLDPSARKLMLRECRESIGQIYKLSKKFYAR